MVGHGKTVLHGSVSAYIKCRKGGSLTHLPYRGKACSAGDMEDFVFPVPGPAVGHCHDKFPEIPAESTVECRLEIPEGFGCERLMPLCDRIREQLSAVSC